VLSKVCNRLDVVKSDNRHSMLTKVQSDIPNFTAPKEHTEYSANY